MSRFSLLLVALAAPLSLVAAPALAGTSLEVNEDFLGVNAGTYGVGPFGPNGASQFSVLTANVDILTPDNFGCVDNPGGNCVDLVGNSGAGGIASNGLFNLAATDTYKVTFGANLQGFAPGQGVTVFDVTLGSQTQQETLTGGVNTQYSLTFAGIDEDLAPLSFLTISAPDSVHGAVIDSIFMTDISPDVNGGGGAGGVPEPASWALMLMGFGGLGAAMRARRRMVLAAG